MSQLLNTKTDSLGKPLVNTPKPPKTKDEIKMTKQAINFCSTCPYRLTGGVPCDWQPESCSYHYTLVKRDVENHHKHTAWAMNIADDVEFDAIRSFG